MKLAGQIRSEIFKAFSDGKVMIQDSKLLLRLGTGNYLDDNEAYMEEGVRYRLEMVQANTTDATGNVSFTPINKAYFMAVLNGINDIIVDKVDQKSDGTITVEFIYRQSKQLFIVVGAIGLIAVAAYMTYKHFRK